MNVKVPLGVLTAVTGVSGSGKSTLVNEVLYKAVANRLNRARMRPGRAQADRGARAARQGHQRRPVADRPHAAVEPGDLHRAVRPDPRPVLQDAGGAGARLQAGPLLVQRQGRALRGLPRRRPDQDRDALPARRLRAVRAVPRQALQPRDARHPLQGQDDRRRARDADRGGARVLRPHPEDPPPAADAARRRARLHAAGPAGDDAVGRRGAARQAGVRALQGRDGADALHPRRADDRPALRRHREAARGAAAAGRPGQLGRRDRAQPRRDQDRRPAARHGPGGRRGGRLPDRGGHARGGRGRARVGHRRVPVRAGGGEAAQAARAARGASAVAAAGVRADPRHRQRRAPRRGARPRPRVGRRGRRRARRARVAVHERRRLDRRPRLRAARGRGRRRGPARGDAAQAARRHAPAAGVRRHERDRDA